MNTEEIKLKTLQKKTDRTLMIFKSIWPFKFFPDTVRIDENKVDVIYHNFFFNHFVFSILLKHINGVNVTTGPFFATLSIEITGFEQNPEDIRYLSKGEAQRAKRIILGLVAAERAGIDVSQIKTDSLIQKVEEIGAAKQT